MQDWRGRTPETKGKTKDSRNIERRRGGNNQPAMINGGDKGNSKGEPIATARVMKTAGDEVFLRVGGDDKEEPETVETATVKEIRSAR